MAYEYGLLKGKEGKEDLMYDVYRFTVGRMSNMEQWRRSLVIMDLLVSDGGSKSSLFEVGESSLHFSL